ncbi:MAG TPA: PEP-CTERM sorting domain-containing protein [Pyrinomonadaceae bacterium]|nr:PEP-CTERM sorting domain-containing protein [Pyrinomonadaceae bacterium]
MFNNAIRRLTRRSGLPVALLLLLLLSAARTARADEIAVWNFNDSDLLVDHGSGTLTTTFNPLNVVFAAGTLTNARQGDLAGQALSLQGGTGNANNGRNITFNVSTVGFSAIVVSFATQGTGTGFTSNQFQYSLDGVTFVDFNPAFTPPAAFGSSPIVFTLSGIAELDNNPNAAFRIVFNGATSASGNNRIDNLVVQGSNTTIPEPTSVLLLGSGLTAAFKLLRGKTTPRRCK